MERRESSGSGVKNRLVSIANTASELRVFASLSMYETCLVSFIGGMVWSFLLLV